MDSIRTYCELVGGEAGEHYARKNFEPACSGVVLYLGLKQRSDHLLHHDFVFSRDPKEEFDHIYRRGEPAPDPTCYIAAPAATDPSVAPPGGEALHGVVHPPHPRPRLLHRGAGRHGPERRASRGRGALRPRPHALSSPASRLAADVPGLPP